MSVRIGINGFGRIGRDVCRAAAERAVHGITVGEVASPDPVLAFAGAPSRHSLTT